MKFKIALACASALLAGACAVSGTSASIPVGEAGPRVPLTELALVDDPRTHEGPSTATLASRVIEAPDTAPSQTLPVTVTSHDRDGDVDVTVADTSRVVAFDMAGTLSGTIWGLGFGDSLVGRDISSQFPGSEDVEVVTASGHSINAEAVLALRPTLIITDGSVGPRDVVEQLRDTGVPVVFVENEPSFDGAAELARDLGEVFGAPAAGEQLADRISSEIDKVTTEIAAIAPTDDGAKVRMMFLYIRGNSGIYYLFGEESGADELINAMGGIDIAAEQGWDGMRPMTDEAVVAANPDLVLVMTHGLESAGGVDGLLSSKPALALTNAGKHRRIVDMADGDVLSFGPRSAGVLDALARAVYAPEV